MDSALGGVLVGSILSLAGTLIQQWSAAAKEKREWANRREVDDTNWRRSVVKEEAAGLRDAYHNAIYSLTVICAFERSEAQRIAPDSPNFDLVRDAAKWISQLSVRHPSEDFDRKLKDFLDEPTFYADTLRDYILRLAKAEAHLHSFSPLNVEEPKRRVAGRREFRFSLDHDFRRDQFIAGNELPAVTSISYPVSKLTDRQREILIGADPHLLDSDALVMLPLPTVNRSGELNNAGAYWRARISPSSPPAEIFAAWERDYQAEYEQLTRQTRPDGN